MPRTPPPPVSETSRPPVSESSSVTVDQSSINRLYGAYTQRVSRTNHLEHRFDRFRHAIQKDATDLALVVHGHEKGVTEHCREIRQLSDAIEEVQAKIAALDAFAKKMLAHEHHVNQTIDRNTHSQTASICGIIDEQEDLRKLVEGLANRLDQSQDSLSTPRGETNTSVLLDMSDLKTKVSRLTEQHTKLEGDVSFLRDLHERVEELGFQIVKWGNRLPDLNDENDEKVPTAIEVQEELSELTDTCFRKFNGIFTRLSALEGMVGTLEHSREESWEAVSNHVSTLVESSVTSISGSLTELEHALQSQRTTPVETEDTTMNEEAWAASEQVIWAELERLKEQMQEVPRLYDLFEKSQQAQRAHEKQLVVLRCFSKHVEQHLEQLNKGAIPPEQYRQHTRNDGTQGMPQTYESGASASSSAVPLTLTQMSVPPTVSPPPIPTSRVGSRPCPVKSPFFEIYKRSFLGRFEVAKEMA